MATFEVIVRPLAGIPGTESKSLSASIRSVLAPSLILTQNPRSLVQLVVQSLSPSLAQSRTNPSLTASLINASSLAFVNASSVPMQGVVCAVAVGRHGSSRAIILDPSDEELFTLDASGVFAYLFSGIDHDQEQKQRLKSTLVWSNFIASPSPFTESELVSVHNLAQKGAERVWHTMKQAVANFTSLASQGRPLNSVSYSTPKTKNTTSRVQTNNADDIMEADERMEI